MEQSPLSKLPPELRNKIYSEVLVIAEDINVARPASNYVPPRWGSPVLLQICRQLREEESPIFYGLNSFCINSYEDINQELSSWIVLLGRKTSSYIRRIRFYENYHIEEVDSCIHEAREHLQKKGMLIPAATIEVGLGSQHYRRDFDRDRPEFEAPWVSSAYDKVLDSLPLDRQRRDDILEEGEVASIRWDLGDPSEVVRGKPLERLPTDESGRVIREE